MTLKKIDSRKSNNQKEGECLLDYFIDLLIINSDNIYLIQTFDYLINISAIPFKVSWFKINSWNIE